MTNSQPVNKYHVTQQDYAISHTHIKEQTFLPLKLSATYGYIKSIVSKGTFHPVTLNFDP